MKTPLKGALIAAAVAGLFVARSGQAQSYRDGLAATVHCEGANACKGQSSCKSDRNACSGKNDCKGKGWIATSADECKEKGGEVK